MTDAQKIALITEIMEQDERRLSDIQEDKVAHFSGATRSTLRNERGYLKGKIEKARAQLAALKGEKPAKKKRTRKKAG